jgi:hypothetical protein
MRTNRPAGRGDFLWANAARSSLPLIGKNEFATDTAVMELKGPGRHTEINCPRTPSAAPPP